MLVIPSEDEMITSIYEDAYGASCLFNLVT